MNLLRLVMGGKTELLRKELSAGADANETGEDQRTLLMHAVLQKDLGIVRLLLESGSDLNRQDRAGHAALHFAAQEYVPDIAEILISHGAIVDIEDRHGNTPLARAVFESRGRGEVIGVLLRAGAQKNHQNKRGISPEKLAKSIGNYDVSVFLG